MSFLPLLFQHWFASGIHFSNVVQQFPRGSSARIIRGRHVEYLRRTAQLSTAVCAEQPQNFAEKVMSSMSRTLSQLFSLPSSRYNTRSASSSQLNLPPNRSSFGHTKSFSFVDCGALWWSLPQNIWDTRDFTRYYSLCQRHYYQWYLTLSLACAWYFSDIFFIILYYMLIFIGLLHVFIYQFDFDL